MPWPVVRSTLSRSLAAAVLMVTAVGAVFWGPSALSQRTTQDRVELIMDRLPPAGSAEYKALLQHAGRAKGQVLPLTGTEMWSVPKERLARLQKAAAAMNVSIEVLDETWNEVFAPMPAGASMEAKAKAMHDMAMQSPMTGSVGMMSMRRHGAVEYALTKDMHDSGAGTRPTAIRIGLNDKQSITVVRQSVVIRGDHCVWRGVVEGTQNPVTIMWWGSGRVSGTIRHGDRTYQLKQFGDDTIGVVESMMDRMPDEHPRTSPKRMQEMRMREDTPFMHGDSSAMRPRPKRGETQDAQDAPDGEAVVARLAVKPPKVEEKATGKATSGAKSNLPLAVIDVMVVYTERAARHYSDIRRDLIELAIEEANQSFRTSRIDNVSVRLVHAHKTDYVEDGAEHFDHVWRMVDRDAFMEEVPRLRDEKKADVVVLIVDDRSGCGLATRVAPDADEAYAVVHHECATTSYSLAHEIGHIIGARHDRSLDQSTSPHPHGHGFVSPDLKWRTMMSYKAGCNGCPRLPVWSTPDRVVSGKAAGDPMHNNAAVIRENASRVAAFR